MTRPDEEARAAAYRAKENRVAALERGRKRELAGDGDEARAVRAAWAPLIDANREDRGARG